MDPAKSLRFKKVAQKWHPSFLSTPRQSSQLFGYQESQRRDSNP
jgi:hypothetical protein